MASIIIVCGDLIFKTKIDSILQSNNLISKKYSDFNRIDFESLSEPPYLIIVDLETKSTDYSLILEKKNIFGEKMYLLGYCSHVLTDIMQKAKTAGFDEILPRSKFVKNLPDLLNNFDKLLK